MREAPPLCSISEGNTFMSTLEEHSRFMRCEATTFMSTAGAPSQFSKSEVLASMNMPAERSRYMKFGNARQVLLTPVLMMTHNPKLHQMETANARFRR